MDVEAFMGFVLSLISLGMLSFIWGGAVYSVTSFFLRIN